MPTYEILGVFDTKVNPSTLRVSTRITAHTWKSALLQVMKDPRSTIPFTHIQVVKLPKDK